MFINRKWLSNAVDFVRRGLQANEPKGFETVILDFEGGKISGGSRESWHEFKFQTGNLNVTNWKGGPIRVDGLKLLQILNGLPGQIETVVIEVENNSLIIRSSSSGLTEFHLPIESEECPDNLIAPAPGISVELTGLNFRELVAGTAWAASDAGAFSAMRGVAVFLEELGEKQGAEFVSENDNCRVSFVATDGRRLALAATGGISSKALGPDSIGLLMVSRIQKIMGFIEPKSIVRISFSKQTGTIRIMDEENSVENFMVSYLLPTGKFPDFRKVEPTGKPGATVLLEEMQLTDGVRAASITADRETKRLDLEIADTNLFLSAQGTGGRSRVAIPLEDQAGGKEKISLNSEYCLESLKGLGKTKVEIWGKEKPIRFSAINRKLPRWVLLMPQV